MGIQEKQQELAMRSIIKIDSKQGLSFDFNYQFLEGSCLAVVEFSVKNAADYEYGIELFASHICNAYNLNPLRLIVLSAFKGQWNMIQFSNFYNDMCRIYKKDLVEYKDIEGLVNGN